MKNYDFDMRNEKNQKSPPPAKKNQQQLKNEQPLSSSSTIIQFFNYIDHFLQLISLLFLYFIERFILFYVLLNEMAVALENKIKKINLSVCLSQV